MSEQARYNAQKKKLDGLCNQHNLTFRFDHDNYPLTLSVRPLQGMYDQLSLLEEAEDGAGRISQDAVLTFIKKDGDISFQIFGTFSISEALQNKLKTIFKKMCENWEGFFFRTVIECRALRPGLTPVIDEAEDDENPQQGDVDGDPEEDEESGNVIISKEELDQAAEIVRMENKATTSLLQRKMKIGYSKAEAIMDALEELRVVGPYKGGEPRDVLPFGEPDAE